MGAARQFLVQECANLQQVLDDTLRFKFGLDGSKEFYEECVVRLKYLVSELNGLADSDHGGVRRVIPRLIELSELISRIERSSISEYSWPFVEELKKIARSICAEETLTDANAPPKIHVLSDGGLDKYAIYTESNRPSSAGKRILTIVFPRSLKHYVLLHSILGHEIGHAMWQCSKHQPALRNALGNSLFKAGPFANSKATTDWLYSPTAPASVKANLSRLASRGVVQGKFFSWASWNAWTEEILCDLIGLITFGPAFLAAECSLLCSLDPAGSGIGPLHPPVGCRTNYLISAARKLGFENVKYSSEKLQTLHNSMWQGFVNKAQKDTWFDVFTDNQIAEAGAALKAIFSTLPSSQFDLPSEADLTHLVDQLSRGVPPNGFQVASPAQMGCRSLDFRQILHAGWLRTTDAGTMSFEQVNRLCEHGIMQQRAIDLSLQAGS